MRTVSTSVTAVYAFGAREDGGSGRRRQSGDSPASNCAIASSRKRFRARRSSCATTTAPNPDGDSCKSGRARATDEESCLRDHSEQDSTNSSKPAPSAHGQSRHQQRQGLIGRAVRRRGATPQSGLPSQATAAVLEPEGWTRRGSIHCSLLVARTNRQARVESSRRAEAASSPSAMWNRYARHFRERTSRVTPSPLGKGQRPRFASYASSVRSRGYL